MLHFSGVTHPNDTHNNKSQEALMKSQASYPVIPVNQLKPGMYVIAIASQTGGMEIAQMGMVTSVAQIANLVPISGCKKIFPWAAASAVAALMPPLCCWR